MQKEENVRKWKEGENGKEASDEEDIKKVMANCRVRKRKRRRR